MPPDRPEPRLFSPLIRAIEHVAAHHLAPELVLAALITVAWTVIAYLPFGPTILAIALVLMMTLHYVAADTGRFSWLWLATGALLLCVVVAYTVDGGLGRWGPLALAAGGSTVLIYNECVRLNHLRRRNPVIGPSIYPAAAGAAGVSCLLGGAGAALAVELIDRGDRPFFWLPVTACVVFAVTIGVLVVPGRLAPHASRERWKPGVRIPPAPVNAPDELQ